MINGGLNYKIDVAGIGYKNKDGEERKDIVKSYLSDCDLSKVLVTLRRHGGNKHDRNAIGIYISTPGFFGCTDEMIGFVDREQAKEISPMLKSGGKILNANITRVWIPERSKTATPYVTLSVDVDWNESDIDCYKNYIKDSRKSKYIREKNKVCEDEIKKQSLLRKFLRMLFR